MKTMSLISDDHGKANLLNKYFSSVSSLDDTDSEIPEFLPRTDSSIVAILITPAEVHDILGTLKLGKASGLDNISHHMLKHTKKYS